MNTRIKDLIGATFAGALLIGYICLDVTPKGVPEPIEEMNEFVAKASYKEVIATYYNPVKEQCDNDPLTTADNSRIDLKKLKQGKIKWIAVSRDLLKDYKMGDTIYVDSDQIHLSGPWIIKDKMNRRYQNRIDFLVHPSISNFVDKPTKVKICKYSRLR